MHFYKNTFRQLRKRKLFASLEIFSLVVGLVSLTLTLLYIRRETGFDNFFSQKNRLFRVNHVEEGGGGNRYSGTPSALGFHARQEIPQVEEVVRIFYPYRMYDTEALVERNEILRFYEDNILDADSTFFKLFDFRFVEGSAANALQAPQSIVLSTKAARRYFGNEPALHQVLKIDNGPPLRVTGVVDVPENTHLDFDFLRPAHHDPAQLYEWQHTLAFTYLLLNAPETAASVGRQLYDIVLRNSGSNNIDYLKNYRHHLQPLQEIHTSVLDWDIVQTVPITQLRVVGFIALAILLLAVANFVNLATARASERAKEVGINKVLGATRGQLVRRYTAEALLLAVLSGAISLYLTWAVIPFFNQLADTRISLVGLADWQMGGLLLAILTTTGLLAGIYPAHVLARIAPSGLTREAQWGRKKGSTRVRQGLVIFQFCITGILLISAFIVHRQLQFMQEKDLGFDQEHILILRVQEPSRQLYETLRHQFLAEAGVLKVAAASTTIGAATGSATFATPEMPEETPDNFAKTISVSPEFLDLMGIPLLQGEGFRPDGTDPRNYFIVNETLTGRFHLDDPLTASFGWYGEAPGKILGVMKDFHFASVVHPITPLVLYVTPERAYRYLFLRIESRNIPATIAAVKSGWGKHVPDFPIDYFFQDARFQSLYTQHEQVRRIASLFSGLAIVLALLGLLGLSVFMVSRRTKEIGIRKVLGASVAGITGLLAKDFLKLVLVAIVMAIPVAYFFMQRWLVDFAYRVDIQWWMFAVAGAGAISVAFLTVGFQSVKAALANPVKSLRSE